MSSDSGYDRGCGISVLDARKGMGPFSHGVWCGVGGRWFSSSVEPSSISLFFPRLVERGRVLVTVIVFDPFGVMTPVTPVVSLCPDFPEDVLDRFTLGCVYK